MESNDESKLTESSGSSREERDAEDKDDNTSPGKRPTCCRLPYVSKRYTIILLLSLGMLVAHAMRVNLAVTVVVILDNTVLPDIISEVNELPHVPWNTLQIGILHSVFYMGYLVTQVPGGYLATKFPPHRMFGASILLSGIFNMLLPLSIGDSNYWLTCIFRIIQGLSEGFLYPTCYAVMRHWTTPSERSWLGSIVLTGVYLGPVVGLSLSGVFTNDFGWQYVYYLHGVAVMVWYIFWLIFSYEKPAYHPNISDEELMMIEKEQGKTALIYQNAKVPWKSIMTSLPVQALNICNFARNWVFYLMLTNEPLYLTMFGFTVVENGFYAALPHALMVVIVISSGPLADTLIQRMTCSRTVVRKMFTGIGFGLEAVCFIILGFVYDGTPAVILLTLGIGVSGMTISGWQINHLDLAPRYASVLVGISTTVGTVAGILIPIITGYLTTDLIMPAWHDVFFLTAAIIIIAVIFYSLFGSGETQAWAEPQANVIIVNNQGPLDNQQKPYGTFQAQTDRFIPHLAPSDEKPDTK